MGVTVYPTASKAMIENGSGWPETADNSAETDSEHDSDHPAEGSPWLPKDVIFSLLSVERRRNVLDYLADIEGQTTLSDLSEHIAAEENDTEISLLSSQQRKRVYVSLYQCHLPKLDEADVIDFDRSRGTIERRPNADLLYPHLALDSRTTATNGPAESGEATTLREHLTTYFL